MLWFWQAGLVRQASVLADDSGAVSFVFAPLAGDLLMAAFPENFVPQFPNDARVSLVTFGMRVAPELVRLRCASGAQNCTVSLTLQNLGTRAMQHLR